MPSSTVTFLFTDIEGSTQLWERHQQAMQAPLARHDALLRQAVLDHNGQIVKMTGDGCHAAFAGALDGALAALQAQQALSAEAWPEIAPDALRVRVGLYAGEAEPRAGDYYGSSVNRAARLMSAAHGGQILVSRAASDLVRDRLPAGASLRDLGEHRLKDLARPEQILQLMAPGLQADFPPIKSLNTFAHNLPVALTPFIGREHEMAEVQQLLTPTPGPSPERSALREWRGGEAGDGARLLTLTGSGGTGKTRLSVQAAAESLPRFPDGAWLVELAPLTDPERVVQTVAANLGLRQQTDRPPFDSLADFLRAKQLLLILDNCEHLIAACADLADRLLRQCPRLKIVATSREALGIAGETTYPVPSLSLPEAHSPSGAALAAGDVARSEAVRLFVDRAQAAVPGFALSDENAPAVAQICRRLDGIPLAIELAAARVRLLRVDQIAARLDDRFRLLTGGSRTALPRQQTLRALIDWSYALLSEPERAFLQQLSVFAGGWMLEAAESVCNGDDFARQNRGDTFDLLTQLANKSLIVVEREAGDETRYRLLETVRQYAREKLLDAQRGDPAPWRDRHLRYFLQYAEQNEPALHSPRLVYWLDRFELEHDNFRAALAWGLDSDALAALQLARALGVFWARRGYVSEGTGWLEAALARASAVAPAEAVAARPYQLARASALAMRALLDFGTMHNIPGVRAAAEESVHLARQLGDDGVLEHSLAVLALASVYWGDPNLAQTAAEEALALARQRNDLEVVLMALGALAVLRLTAFPQPAEARAIAVEGLILARQQGDPWTIAQITLGLGRFASAGANLDEARARVEEAIELFRQIGDLGQVNHARSDLARVLRKHGQTEQAIALYRETLRAWQHMGHRGAVAQQLESLAFIAIELGQGVRAARLLGAAESLRDFSGAVRMTQQDAEYDQALAKLRGQISPAELDTAWAAGRAMGIDEAIEFALAEDAQGSL
jgi:predicted ATPase/class 3 adenylate cyclase